MVIRLSCEPREHDYTRNTWGHALHSPAMKTVEVPHPSRIKRLKGKTVTEQFMTAMGHGSVEAGDTVLLKMASGKVARFVVREIKYLGNPRDMFEIKRADFVEYVEGERS